MLLNQTVEYALRAMACLAEVDEGEAVRASDLADLASIPHHYLSKIMRRMVVAGLVESRRGHGGGFQLSRPPEQIRFIDIFRAISFDPTTGGCVFGRGECDLDNPCSLHPAWSEISETFLVWSTQTTLARVRSGG